MIATVCLTIFGFYLGCGILFAVPFVMRGVGRIDSHATHGSWGFRVLIVPGTVFLWPLMAKRWIQGTQEPPVEKNAHKCAVLHAQLAPRSGK